MNPLPLVTVLVPARNEAADIARCLAHIAAQDYPVNRLEVLVVDGNSVDGTARVVGSEFGRYGFEHGAVLAESIGTTPRSLNLGLRKARGEIICRVDARTLIPPHYVRTCVDILRSRPEVAVVGGAQRAVARDGRALSLGIARALNNRWAMGLSRYRRSSTSGATDTVYLGAFRTADVVAAGGWDERLDTNQDFDLNRRMGKHGVVWYACSLESGYLPRPDLRSLWRQYTRFGGWKVRYWRLTGDRPRPRQVALMSIVPFAAVAGTAAFLRRPWLTVLAGVAAVSVVETHGTAAPRAGVASRAAGGVAIGVVGCGWSWGLWREVIRVPRSRPRS